MTPKTLKEVLCEVEDFRQAKGKRHKLEAILLMAIAAIMSGYKSYSAIAEWGSNYGKEIALALGFKKGKTPCVGTLNWVFRNINIESLEKKLGEYFNSYLGQEALACDGKTLIGASRQLSTTIHLLSIVSQKLGLTIAQREVGEKTNEIPVLQEMLKQLVIEGKILTMDAMHTQRETAEIIVEKGADYVMVVKENQGNLLEEIQTLFHNPISTPRTTCAEETNVGHGRVEFRRLIASSDLVGYCSWPGHQQVFILERVITDKLTGKSFQEIAYGISSLSQSAATASRLLSLVRGHWSIENKSHYVRDFTFDEDRSQAHIGNIPHTLASLRNCSISLIRLASFSNIAQACRFFAANPWLSLSLLGIPRTE